VDAEGSLRAAVAELVHLTEAFDSGTTLAVALVEEAAARVAVAVLGDSAVVVLDSRGRAVASPEHNARTNAAEREAAVRRGGVWDASGYLRNPGSGYGVQLTRALGDAGMGPVLRRIPEVYSVDLGPDSAVVLATDGVFDPSHAGGADVAEQVSRLRRPGRPLDAKGVIEWSERRGLQDNATAVVWETRALLGGPSVPA
jgi:serine/threonine protein phosphatase PrpC